jgi:hypothetical protein
MSELPKRITRKSIGEPGNRFDWRLGAIAIATNITVPITNVSADPSSDKIAITVTPAERFMSSTSPLHAWFSTTVG